MIRAIEIMNQIEPSCSVLETKYKSIQAFLTVLPR